MMVKALAQDHRGSVAFSQTSETSALDVPSKKVPPKTLGMVVQELLGSFFTEAPSAHTPADVPTGQAGESRFSWVSGIEFQPEDFGRIADELRQFVAMRNEVVHHFFEQQDLASIDGCEKANAALHDVLARIQLQQDVMDQYAKSFLETRQKFADILLSERYLDFFSSGKMPWPDTVIVQACLAAFAELADDGWVPLRAACDLIEQRYPDQRPEPYGCKSWQHLLHESGLFKVERRKLNGRWERYYQPRSVAGD